MDGSAEREAGDGSLAQVASATAQGRCAHGDGVGRVRMATHGIWASPMQAKACVELARRLALERPEERSRIHSPEDIAALVSSEMAAPD